MLSKPRTAPCEPDHDADEGAKVEPQDLSSHPLGIGMFGLLSGSPFFGSSLRAELPESRQAQKAPLCVPKT